MEDRPDFAGHPVGAGQIGLVDDEDVGGLDDAALHRLDLVARSRRQHQHHRIDHVAHGIFDLPDADRLEQHFGEARRSEEHTSELQSLMRISYAVFCLKKKKKQYKTNIYAKTLTQLKNTMKNTNTNNLKK